MILTVYFTSCCSIYQ